jgi:hypothetical protein
VTKPQDNAYGRNKEPVVNQEAARTDICISSHSIPSHYLYKSKMDEFGSIITIERVVKSLKFLEVSQDNFTLVITGPILKLVCEMLFYSFVPCSYEGKFIIDLCSFLCFVA